MPMAAVDVPVALLGYGTVGAAVNRLLLESGDDIERATGHRLRVVRALVRDPARERAFPAGDGVLTTDFASIRDDPSIAVVAEVMGGVEPAGGLRARAPARRQAGRLRRTSSSIARRGAELFAIASEGGVQLRFEAQRVRRDPADQGSARVARRDERPSRARHRQRDDELHPHAHGGAARLRAGARARRSGSATRRRIRRDDVSRRRRGGEDGDPRARSPSARASALDDVALRGHRARRRRSTSRRRASSDMAVRLVGAATLVDGRLRRARRRPAFVDRHHPLAAVEGAFNAVMLQGDAIREITLEGPGAGGLETASAVVADIVSVVGTTATGFLQNDACWRTLERLPPGDLRSPFYVRVEVDDRPGRARARGRAARAHERLGRAPGAAPARRRRRARPRHARGTERARCAPRSRRSRQLPWRCAARPTLMRVISERGV